MAAGVLPDEVPRQLVRPERVVLRASKGGPTRMRLRNWVFTQHVRGNISIAGPSEGLPDDQVSQWDPRGRVFSEKDCRYIICGAEVCPNTGRHHWQGYAEVNRAMGIKAIKELLGSNDVHLEPRRGTQQQAIDYCKKPDTGLLDGDGNKVLFEYGKAALDGVRTGHSKNKNYSEMLQMSTYQEAVQKFRELEPADYLRFGSSVKRGLMEHFRESKVFIRPAESFNVPLISSDVLSKFAYVITGVSGAGKTAFAKAHFKNPLVLSHIDDLKRFSPLEHDGLIFDDMSFGHWPVNSCIHLLDMEDDRSINCRHTCGVIPAWTPRIFTSNKPLHDVFNVGPGVTEEEERAVFRRFQHMHVTKSLFD